METRSTTVHRGLEVSGICYPNLGRRTSAGGEVEVDPGRNPGQPELNSEFLVIFCVFFQVKGGLYLKEEPGCQLPWLPMWDYSHMGARPKDGAPAPSGPHVAH